jgi:hypothetical protein
MLHSLLVDAVRLKTASPPVGFIAQGVAPVSRAKHSFRESDVTRAIRAAAKAGKDVKIEIDLDRHCMSIIPIKPVEAAGNTGTGDDGTIDNPWDDVLNANQKRAS